MPEREDQRTRDDDLGGLDDARLDDDVGDVGDVGLDQDPSDRYGDLVDDGNDGGLLGGGEAPAEPADERSADSDGLLSGFFGSDDLQESDAGGGGSRFEGLFSARAFLAILVGTGALAGIGATLVPFVGEMVGAPVGLFLGTFLAGLIGSERRYAEAGLTGLVLGALAAFGDVIPTAILIETGLTAAAATGAVAGLLIAVLGLYFGRDLRAGLTADIGD